jgi:hypothetical protein
MRLLLNFPPKEKQEQWQKHNNNNFPFKLRHYSL